MALAPSQYTARLFPLLKVKHALPAFAACLKNNSQSNDTAMLQQNMQIFRLHSNTQSTGHKKRGLCFVVRVYSWTFTFIFMQHQIDPAKTSAAVKTDLFPLFWRCRFGWSAGSLLPVICSKPLLITQNLYIAFRGNPLSDPHLLRWW